MTSVNNEWFYLSSGSTIGPISLTEIENKISLGDIRRNTHVLKKGGNWILAEETELLSIFENTVVTTPKISNFYLWLVCAVPLSMSVFEVLFPDIKSEYLIGATLLLNTFFCYLDEEQVHKNNHFKIPFFAKFIVPYYIWKRSSFTKITQIFLIVWCISFASYFAVIEYFLKPYIIEQTACELVTEIIKEQLQDSGSICRGVSLGKEVADGLYRGIAVLNNGHEVGIIIDLQPDNQIYVTISSM